MFRALRMQMDELGFEPDYRVNGLSALVEIVAPIPS
jgi:2-haloacid dehalogenase